MISKSTDRCRVWRKIRKASYIAVACSLLSVSANAAAPGKYICATSHLVGIQYKPDGTTASGNMKPRSPTFFLTIIQATPLEECKNTKMHGMNYWYFCLAKFAAQVDSALSLRGDTNNMFVGFAGGDEIQITDDLSFIYIENVLTGGGNVYTSDGKCTRLQ